MHMCEKCHRLKSVVLLLLGLAFLFVDLGKWTFWNVNWWTAVFLLMGLVGLCASKCPDCCKAKKK